MSSPEKIDANRQNAQHSTGPKTDEGKQRSALNATRHGFTGQTLVLSPEEKEAYLRHVQSYFEEYGPFDAITRQLTQQLADAHWSVHQIFVQQSNIISMINAATTKLMEAGDPLAAATALAPLTRMLQTYTTYEMRRRRAAEAIEKQLEDLLAERLKLIVKQLPDAVKLYKIYKAQGKPWVPADGGFVCSLDTVLGCIKAETMAADLKNFQNQS